MRKFSIDELKDSHGLTDRVGHHHATDHQTSSVEYSHQERPQSIGRSRTLRTDLSDQYADREIEKGWID